MSHCTVRLARTQARYYEQLVKANDTTSNSNASGDEAGTASALSRCKEPVQNSCMALSEDELSLLRWARNSSTISAPRGMGALQYKKATALEALVSA